MDQISGGSGPSDKGGVGPPDPEIRQGVGPGLKKFFLRPFGPQFALKSRGGGGGKLDSSSGSANENAARCVKRLVECANSIFFENFCKLF